MGGGRGRSDWHSGYTGVTTVQGQWFKSHRGTNFYSIFEQGPSKAFSNKVPANANATVRLIIDSIGEGLETEAITTRALREVLVPRPFLIKMASCFNSCLFGLAENNVLTKTYGA